MAALNFLKCAWRAEHSRLKLLLWSSLIGLIFGALQLGLPLEEDLRTARNKLLVHDASGDIVIVGIDDRSIAKIGSWPWPRRHHAKLVENLQRAGAERIAFDISFSSPSNPVDDALFEKALARSNGKVTLATLSARGPASIKKRALAPLTAFSRHTRLASIDVYYNRQNAVWEMAYARDLEGTTYPSLAALLANIRGSADERFHVDYSLRLPSVPVVSAVDILEGRALATVAGKDVVIGTTAKATGDVYFAPGYGRIPGVYIHVAGAETLRAGRPFELGWAPALLLTVLFAAACLLLRRVRVAIAALSAVTLVILIAPLALQSASIIIDIVPALVLILLVTGRLVWRSIQQSYRNRASTNAVSGLLNLAALRDSAEQSGRFLVAARVNNFAEVASALPPEKEKALALQIASRLTLGRADLKLYHGDEGVFVWFPEIDDAASLHDHLDALHAMFRSPANISGDSFDLTITFGVDASSERSLTNRLGSALVAADDAASGGQRWKEFDPDRLKDAGWRLSLLSQLDLAHGRIVGAEALARWTHPEKGPISPLEFIVAAEQGDRIEKLTYHVLDEAIAAAAAINSLGFEFGIAVNLSARLIDQPEIIAVVTDLLATHRLAARHLTLEVTETAALNNSGSDFKTLDKLRELGVQISIDDYGTGLSTLNYLRRIPATEIKIDRSFVQAMTRSRDDMVLVTSTIELAHSLGHRVVAEGVEEPETLEALVSAGCDLAQGYLIGKPLALNAFQKDFFKSRRSKAA